MKTHDYVSANLEAVDLRNAFPEMVPGDRAKQSWPYLRREIAHTWYVDRRNPTVGFISSDEASILYNTAKMFVGRACLEIGCWRGWSTAHVAAGCRDLDVIDPVLADESFLEDVRASLHRAEVLEHVRLHVDFSPEAVHRISRERRKKWSFAFIDGDHEGEAPRKDAEAVLQYAAKDALIAFHDLASPHVSAGLAFLAEEGWNTRIYQTMQIMGVAWRGDITPVDHVPDPTMTWSLPAHLQELENYEGRARRARRASGTKIGEQVSTPLKADVHADGFSALQQRYVSLAERYEALGAREEQARNEARHWQDQYAAIDKSRSELEQLLTAKLTQQSGQIGELRATLDDERRTRPEVDSALANALTRAEQAEAAIMDLIATKQQIASLRTQLEKIESARELADKRASSASSLAESQTQALLSQTQIATDLARKVNDLTAQLHHRESAPQPPGIAIPTLDFELIEEVILKYQSYDSSRRIERASVDDFARWAASTRVLLGLLRRRVKGSAEAARQIAIDQALRSGLPADVAGHIATWLTSRRVLTGLLRRSVFSSRATSIAIVVSNIYWSTSNESTTVEAPDFDVRALIARHTPTLPVQGPVVELAPPLSVGEPSSDLLRLHELEREVGRLRQLEESRSIEEAELADLRVEIEVLRHRVKRDDRSKA